MSEVKPALTREEWERLEFEHEGVSYRLVGNNLVVAWGWSDFDQLEIPADVLPGLMALANRVVQLVVQGYVDAARTIGQDFDDTIKGHQLVLLAERTAALLPPREEPDHA